ncbi:MAG: 4Fe-4S binding protein [Oscillospiraceae bacterium]|nr:4Fe-4S binding protein [Oscillospiraceae bacterium]
MKDKSKSKSRGLVLDPSTGKLRPVSFRQKMWQWVYGFCEPAILRGTDFMLKTPKRAESFNRMATPKMLPREVVVTSEAACRFIDFIYSQNTENNSARMAVTKCVCQTATKTFREPVMKDMALLYTADMYTSLKHTGIKEPFHIIETAEEAKSMIRYFDECGLVHTVMYCNSSGKWTFVVCNCDDEVCIPMKAYKLGRRDQVLAGPETVSLDREKCLGCSDCGKCIERYIFGCNAVGEDGKSTVDSSKCLGCGLCAVSCPSGARTMIPRDDYEHEDKLTTAILLGK